MANNLSKVFKYVNSNGESITFTYDDGFLISKPEGIDTLSITLNEAQGINQTGTTIQSINIQSRPVTITGRLCGSYQSVNKNKLISVIRPDLPAKLYADDYYLEVRPIATPTIEARKNFAAFQFQLLAAYPYWQRDESAIAKMSSVDYMFKFPWNISRPYKFGVVSEEVFIGIINNGQVPIPYTITFIARDEVVNPEIIDTKTNKYLRINKTMTAWERLTVEITHDRTYANSNIDGECRGAIDLSSNFYRLAVGDNVLKPDAESGGSNLTVEITYSIEFVGVVL